MIRQLAQAAAVAALVCGCSIGDNANADGCGTSGGGPGLAATYAGCFPIGAATNSTTYQTHAPILTQHFSSVTCENEMKFDALEPTENYFTYGPADNIVAFAVGNGMKVRGHTLVWHRQDPAWLFIDSTGAPVSSDVLLARMRNHIANVVGHFKGKVYAWDVVNEAMMDDGTYRTGDEPSTDSSSSWYGIIGPSYIAEAFQAAHDADPDAKLFYNDYRHYLPAKRDAIYNMLQNLLAAGVPIHGVGLQAHLNIQPSTNPNNQSYQQTVAAEEEAIKLYATLGLDVQITEMDISLYIAGMQYTPDMFYTAATFTDALQASQADRYREFFQLFRRYRGVITGVTTWGIADDATWLSQLSSGRQDFPLLFDLNHQPKKAFDAVVGF
jgi:endo-1,4-beta-xylanase